MHYREGETCFGASPMLTSDHFMKYLTILLE